MAKKNSTLTIAIIAIVALAGFVVYDAKTSNPLSVAGASGATGTGVSVGCAQNPAYSYSAVDLLNGVTVGGTDLIKANGNYPVSTLANPTAGDTLKYTKTNASYFCELSEAKAECNSHTLQTKCYQNGTLTMTVYDSITNTQYTGVTSNLTMGANAVANVKVVLQGTAKAPSAPFGGCLVIERPSTVTSVDVSGEGISSATPCAFPLTYTVSSTSNTYSTMAIPAGFDINGAGVPKILNMQLKSGATDVTTSVFKVSVVPANYYTTLTGDVVLGVEKSANQDTTRTFASQPSVSIYLV